MSLFYHNDTGILMYSEENLFNYNQSNLDQWYNHTFVRKLIHFEIKEENQNNDDNNPETQVNESELFLLIIGILGISASISIISLELHQKLKAKHSKRLKNNPKFKKNNKT